MSLNEKKIRKTIKGKKNVSGYVKTIQKRIRNGVEVDEDVTVQEDAELVVVRVTLRQIAKIEEPVIAEEVVESDEEPSPAEGESPEE